MLKKICIIGPESTGKSSLCKHLAEHYHSTWVPEYAREYLLKHGMHYTYHDLLTIAKGQIQLEEQHITSATSNIKRKTSNLKPLFIDTDMYVMKVWSEFVFSQCHKWILNEIVNRKYDLYLLCDTDLLWVKDELREYPDLESRQVLFKMYKDILVNQSTPWTIISGSNDQRHQSAIRAVDGLKVPGFEFRVSG